MTDWNLQVIGKVPPKVKVISQANAAQGLIAVDLLDITLKLNLNFGDGMQEVLNTKVDIQSPFDIGITPNNKLTISIEAVPTVNVQTFSFRLNGLVLNTGTSDAVRNLIATIAPQFLPKALQAIGGNLVPAAAAASAAAPVVSASVEEKTFLSALFGEVSVDDQRRAIR